jgi:hypothetical protein
MDIGSIARALTAGGGSGPDLRQVFATLHVGATTAQTAVVGLEAAARLFRDELAYWRERARMLEEENRMLHTENAALRREQSALAGAVTSVVSIPVETTITGPVT